jgi:CBS domain-containing protein
MRTVAQDMRPAPARVDPDATLQQASAAMLDAATHEALVARGDRLVGVLTADEVAQALSGGDATRITAADIVRSADILARPDEPLAEAHQRMRAAHRPIAVVVDSHGRPVGMLIDPEAA